MDEHYNIERNVSCSVVDKDVFQKLNYFLIRTYDSLIAEKTLTGTFCTGYPKCNSKDCQLVIGIKGKVYSELVEE